MSIRKSSAVTKKQAAQTPPPPPAAPPAPLFYRNPEPVSPETHGALRLKEAGFGFASSTNAVPLVGAEFPQAAHDYPVVFAPEDGWPVALLGLTAQNAFVDEAGAWAPDTYIPAYVRRYPFAFIASEDRFILALDRDAAAVNETEGVPLFENGEPSPALSQALAFCGQFQEAHRLTRAFVDALKEHDLLVNRVADAKLRDKRSFRLGAFQVVDRERWRNLPDAAVVAFHKAGWSELVAAHLASVDRFSMLVERVSHK